MLCTVTKLEIQQSPRKKSAKMKIPTLTASTLLLWLSTSTTATENDDESAIPISASGHVRKVRCDSDESDTFAMEEGQEVEKSRELISFRFHFKSAALGTCLSAWDDGTLKMKEWKGSWETWRMIVSPCHSDRENIGLCSKGRSTHLSSKVEMVPDPCPNWPGDEEQWGASHNTDGTMSFQSSDDEWLSAKLSIADGTPVVFTMETQHEGPSSDWMRELWEEQNPKLF